MERLAPRSSLPGLLFTFLLAVLAVTSAPAPAQAAHVTFGQPEATARLGQEVMFQTTLQASGAEPPAVELLVRLPTERAVTVVPAEVVSEGGSWRALAILGSEPAPNTRLSYRFRARAADHTVLGPEAETVLVDDRFAWRSISGAVVRVHWYEGDEAFARRALDIGERAVQTASELLGVSETEPIDFFIYASEADLREALGPGTRENVGGQAHPAIRTLFGLIDPQASEAELLAWLDSLIPHELTHLVFDTATDNPYHAPPRWLNEGVAVYLADRYGAGDRAAVQQAAADGSLIPLDGLGGLFPTTPERLFLAYAESVSAVDFFIRTHGEQTLWDLVASYARGVSDEEAFQQATGAGLAAFNEAWMASLGAQVPEPAGPQPAPPGPLPPGWEVEPSPLPPAAPPGSPMPGTNPPAGSATASPAAASAAPTVAPTPARPPASGTDGTADPALALLVAVLVVLAIIALAMLVQRRRSPGPRG